MEKQDNLDTTEEKRLLEAGDPVQEESPLTPTKPLFDYLDYKNRIPIEKCLIEIPKINPLSLNYKKFWNGTMKRKQIEGHWVEHNGDYQWIPGVVVQFINLYRIERKPKGGTAKGKIIGKPDLRDIEWIKGFIYSAARGFSGFEGDDKYSCHRILTNPDKDLILPYLPEKIKNTLYNSKGELKEYKEALPYLYEYKKEDLGKPYFYNEALNVIEIGARNYGKSIFSSNMCAHNFLTDGIVDYDEWYENSLKHKDDRETFTTQTLIGAIDAKYVNTLTKHLKVGLDHLPGATKTGGINYPPPLSKKYKGSWVVGKDIEARYSVKVGGEWEWKGSGSGFSMRSFNDNPYAANGLRYGFGLIDEVGFMGNLLDTLGQLHECTTADGEKYGSIWLAGTGGDMIGGATEAAMKIFYNGASEGFMEFDDVFENKGKIGFFVPAWMTLSEYRDELGNINKELAMKKLLKEREKASKSDTKETLYNLLQMKPLKPSEAFLVLEGNIFPVGELKEHLANLESSESTTDLGNTGMMRRDEEGKAIFKVDHTLKPADYPTNSVGASNGCVVVWEEPIENPPYGLYVAGIDSYDIDKVENSVSFGSIFIYKRFVGMNGVSHLPVAEYTGRPDFANDFYEQCRRLLEWYNAKALYENLNVGIKKYFETKFCTHLLHSQPDIIKQISPNSNVNRGYGIHMTKPIKTELEIMVRDWLNTEISEGKNQLTKILSIPLLKELIAYNDTGNFDRVIAFSLCILQDIEMHRVQTVERTNKTIDDFFDRRLFI